VITATYSTIDKTVAMACRVWRFTAALSSRGLADRGGVSWRACGFAEGRDSRNLSLIGI
jgi:hypothetical protein